MSEQDVAVWGKESPTPGQLKEFFAQIESGRVTNKRLQIFLDGQEANTRPTVVAAAREFYPEEQLPREILGEDYLAIGEVEKATNQPFTDDQVAMLRGQLSKLDKKTLASLKKKGVVLMAQPAKQGSLIEVRNWARELFYTKEKALYENHPFARDEQSSKGLIALRKEVVPGSLNKTWDEQLGLLQDGEVVPNAAEFTSCVTIYAKVRGIRLFPGVYARVNSVAADGDRVDAGYFDSKGLDVHNHWDDHRHSHLGVASAWKFN